MRSLASLLLVLAAGGLTGACAYARAIPIGAPAPARPPDCPLAYARLDPVELQTQWREVGDVCVSAGTGFSHMTIDDVYEPGTPHDLLTERACALGGQMVTPVGLCSNGKSSAIEFGVYVARGGELP